METKLSPNSYGCQLMTCHTIEDVFVELVIIVQLALSLDTFSLSIIL